MPLRLEQWLGAPDSPVLNAYIGAHDLVSIIRGPRSSGKTFGSSAKAALCMIDQEPNERGVRPTRGMVSRDSYTELMSTTVKDFMSVFEGLGSFSQSGLGPPTWRSHPLYLEDGTQIDAEVIFQSAGVNDAAERVKGYQLTWAWFNEFSGIDRAVFSNTRAALSRYPSRAAGGVPCTRHGVFADTNSFDESHWLFPLAANPPEHWRWYHQPGGVIDSGRTDGKGRKIWLPNPNAENLGNLVGREQFYLQLCEGETDDYIRVLLANEYGFYVEGMPVHPWYVDSVHCAQQEFEPESGLPIIIGGDFGRTPAATLWQHMPNGRWTCFDELTSENMSASVFGPELKRLIDRRYPGAQVSGWGDPAGDKSGQTVETTPIEIMRAAGVPMLPAPTNVTALRRAALSNPGMRLCMDGRPALLISPRARMLRKGLMGGFCYRRMKLSGPHPTYTEEPDKNQFSHVVESAEYALLGAGEMHAALRPPETMRRQREPQPAYDPLNW